MFCAFNTCLNAYTHDRDPNKWVGAYLIAMAVVWVMQKINGPIYATEWSLIRMRPNHMLPVDKKPWQGLMGVLSD